MVQGGNGNGWGPPGGSGPQGWGPPGGFPPPPGGFGGGFTPPPPGAPPPGPPYGRPPPWAPPPGGFAPIPQGYPPGYTPPQGGGSGFTPTEAISFAWERIKADPGNVLGPLVVGTLVLAFAGGFTNGLADILEGPAAGAVAMVGIGISLALQAFMNAGMCHFSLKVARGEPFGLGDIFAGGRWFFPALGISFFTWIAVAFGLLLLIIPGIFLALAFAFSLPAAVDRDLGAIEAMSESFRLTQGHRFSIFLLGFLLAGIGLLGLCACGIGVLVASAIGQLAFAYAYVCVSGPRNNSR